MNYGMVGAVGKQPGGACQQIESSRQKSPASQRATKAMGQRSEGRRAASWLVGASLSALAKWICSLVMDQP